MFVSVDTGITRSDAAILAASLRHSPAFAELFSRHWPRLHAYCTSRAGAAGEDIAAEAFRVAFDRRARYREEHGEVRPWLYGIAIKLLQHHFRDAQRHERARRRFAGLSGFGSHAGPAGELERHQLGAPLATAVGNLPAIDREVLLLWAWAELEYEEIARALDVPVGTVRSRLNRARRRVRESLQEER